MLKVEDVKSELNFGVEHEAYKIADLMRKAEKPEETLT